ncbi:MAG: MFS transporter [Dehalococcoidia bacterium]|jgi:OFA family oxalate/formate antiporter-like MFS transporter|uniref:MFS transporter n=1 Tax=Candidatus Amarobacter glycogenicus TaxID=3140699 RepID=UPI002A1856A5|nr:MFS transporter [Dehalococcoidia bacterium]MBK6562131.1 MFS transporter [Dehalococcoidia bacterium]MBK7124676.1 MFS transporter [Dehalococcoidia bacterium]MBK7327970.1 MFS transporter [Dehalococcoidia bacterium]MBK8561199.1 MFS transporter [Dehalococcoidia bacterium]
MGHEIASAGGASAENASRRIYYGYWLIGAAFVAQFVAVGSQNYVVGAFLKPMTTELDWTRSEFTLSRTLAQVIMAFTGFFIGGHVDRNGGRKLMLVGIVILSTSLFSMSYVQSLWQWIALNGMAMTIGAAMIGNLVVNVTLSKWFVEKRGLAVALASMGVSFAGVLLTPVMTAVIDEWGWRWGWRWMGIGAAVLIIPISMVMRRAPEDYGLHPDGKSPEDVASGGGMKATADFASSLTRQEALRTVSFYMLVFAFGMFGLTIGVMLLHTIPFMTDAEYSRSTAAFMITLASIPALISKPFWGLLMDKTDPKRLASISAVITGVSLIVITTSVKAHNDPIIWGGFLLLGFGWGGMIPLQELIWATFFGRRHLGSVRSAGLPFSLFLGAGAPLLVSMYVDRVGDYDGALLAVAGMNLAAAVLLLFIKKPMRAGGLVPARESTAPS